jgi:endoglucanase
MTNLAVAGLLMAASALASPAAAQSAPERSPVACHGALSVSGGQIVDAHGEPVTLRGMSLFWSQWAPRYYSAETVAWLAQDWQVDVVRAAIAAEGNDSARQHFEREFAKASAVIDAAVANGLYVVVDWHAHRAHPDEAERFLTAIAAKYGHLPNLVYEDWNEPLRDGVEWSRDVKPYHERILGAVRAIDPDNLMIAGSPSWSQDVDAAAQDPLPFANLAYTLHYYAGTHRQELRDKGDAARAKASPCSSPSSAWSMRRRRPDRARGKRTLVGVGRSHRIGWMAWSIGDRDESSAALRPGTCALGLDRRGPDRRRQAAEEKLRAAAGRNPACHASARGIR